MTRGGGTVDTEAVFAGFDFHEGISLAIDGLDIAEVAVVVVGVIPDSTGGMENRISNGQPDVIRVREARNAWLGREVGIHAQTWQHAGGQEATLQIIMAGGCAA